MTAKSISRICSIDGCEGKHKSRNFCNKHYRRVLRYGNTNTNKTNKGVPANERFDMKVEISPDSDCHLWVGSRNSDGYGYIRIGEKAVSAHRYSWYRHKGSIPNGLCVLHKCDNPRCVNPDHLFLGSHQDNMKDRDKKGRGNNARGESQGQSKLTETEIIEIRAIGDGQSNPKIAKKYNVGVSTIWCVLNRKTWRHIK